MCDKRSDFVHLFSEIMANNGSYSNDRPAAAADPESATDPASGSFFHSDYKK